MRINRLIGQIKYKALLETFEWKLKANEIKKRDGYKCQYCGSGNDLQAHHLVYLIDRMPWDYPGNYYMTLCERCHLFEHSCLDNISFNIDEALLSGMLAIDIYKKLKNNEQMIFID